MKALVLDFDGVLFDSARESFAVARSSYLGLRPESPIAGRDEEELYREFVELMPLGNGSSDYGAMLTMLEQGKRPADQHEYDRLRGEQQAPWLDDYRLRFLAVRHEWSSRSPDEWRGLMPPYGEIVALLRKRRGEAAYAIGTAKDRRSVDLLLAAYGLADLFPSELVQDNRAGPVKSAHLEALQKDLGLPFEELTFVDDKVNHLDAVAPLGVRCVLAAWGYNGPREYDLARTKGYLVCTFADVEYRLFDS